MKAIFLLCLLVTLANCQKTEIYNDFFFRDQEAVAEFVKEGETWITFQRRVNNKVDFYRDYAEYERGFGEVDGSFWLGLKNLYDLAKERTELLIVMKEFDGTVYHAKYDNFQLGDAASKYQLTVKGYSGNAENAMDWCDGSKFTTKDQDNDAADKNCAENFKGGWWYKACHHANLNGIYYGGNGTHTNYADGINWFYKTTYQRSLMEVRMLVKKL